MPPLQRPKAVPARAPSPVRGPGAPCTDPSRFDPGRAHHPDAPTGAPMDLTLLLNVTFEPMKVIPWQRALTLLVLGKVELVEPYAAVVRTVSRELALPAVVRLRRYARHERRVKLSRHNVFRRDGFTCQYCGDQPGPAVLTLDHVTPRALGGPTTWDNLVTACRRCNARKAARTPEQASMPLARRPHRPAHLPLVPLRAETPAPWLGYLDAG